MFLYMIFELHKVPMLNYKFISISFSPYVDQIDRLVDKMCNQWYQEKS